MNEGQGENTILTIIAEASLEVIRPSKSEEKE